MVVTVYTITPFDVTDRINTHTIKFRQLGNAVTNNRCIIKDLNGNTVYEKTVASKKYSHDVDLSISNSLANGNTYLVYIQVSSDNGTTQSEMSTVGENLLCLATPVFRFDINNGSTITNSAYEFLLSYSQSNNELLESYQITLYSSAKTQIATSGTKYVSNANSSRFTWTYYSFETSNSYFIRATGVTVHNVEVDTGFIGFNVYYEHPSVFSFLEATNIPRIGGIQLKTNFVEVKGQIYDINTGKEINTDNVKFRVMSDGGRALILQPNQRLEYDTEIYFKDDFSIALVFEEMYPNVPLFTLTYKDKNGNTNTNSSTTLYQRIGRNGIPDDYTPPDGSYYPDQSGWFELIDKQSQTNNRGNKQTFNRIYSSNVKRGAKYNQLSSYKYKDLYTYLYGADECNVKNTQGNISAGSVRGWYYVVQIKRKDNLQDVSFDKTTRKETGAIDRGVKY